MKSKLTPAIFAIVIFTVSSCHGNQEQKDKIGDTAKATSADTTVMPGSPGASGTEPRANDTTQAHRDSLKKEADIAPPKTAPEAKP